MPPQRKAKTTLKEKTQELDIITRFPINVIPYGNTKITTVYHLSDIHIHLFKRHDEYTEVFNRVLTYLQTARNNLGKEWVNAGNNELPCVVVITGDILHCKSDLSPECVAMTYKLFKDIAAIMPLIIIPGNHDMNINNKMRMDSLTPIIGDLPKYYPIHYLNKTGLWYMGGCLFSHASIFDYYIIDPAIVTEELNNLINDHPELNIDPTNVTRIALYHGRINGVELFNGRQIEGEKAGKGTQKRTITVNNFKGYDIGMFGDIHKHQFLDKSCSRGYAGSLIQQNYGEDLDGHGLIKWNINKRRGEFVSIANDWGYYTFYVKGGKCNVIGRDSTGKNIILTREFPPNICARVLYDSATTQVQLSSFGALLDEKFNVMDYCCQSEASVAAGSGVLTTTDEDTVDKIDDTINIRDIECQNKMLRHIINEEFEGVPEEDIELIMEINRDANKLLNTRASLESGLGDDIENTGNASENISGADGRRFKLIRLEFDNFFCYGKNNYVDFRECEGVVGIVASNHMGKSAILDILLYALYDKFPRKGTAKDIINIRKNTYRVRLELKMGSYHYAIEKSGERTKSGGIGKTKCLFTRKHLQTGKITNMGEMTAKKLKDRISCIFGSYEDMINTNFSIQTNSTGFIDSENTARRKELERVLRFDFINELVKEANDNYRHNKSVFEHLQQNLPPEVVQKLAGDIEDKMDDVVALEKARDKLSKQSVESQKLIDSINTQINPDVDKKMDDILSDVDMTVDDIADKGIEVAIQTRRKDLDNEKTRLSKNLTDLGKKIQSALIESISIIDADNVESRYVNEVDWLNKLKVEKIPAADKARMSELLATIAANIKEQRKNIKTRLDTINAEIYNKRRTGIVSYKVISEADIKKWLSSNNKSEQCVLDRISELISKCETERKNLITELDGYDKLDNVIESLEAKISKHREKITTRRQENDTLVEEDIPDILRNEVKNKDIVKKSQQDIDAVELEIVTAGYRFKGKQKEMDQYRNLVMKRGWLFEIETRIESVSSNRRKIDANRKKIKEYEARIIDWTNELTTCRNELKKGAIHVKELEKLTTRVNGLRSDIDIWKTNCKLEHDLAEIEESRDELQNMYLDTKVTDKLATIREWINDYGSLEVEKRQVKAQQKAIISIKKQLDDLMKEIEKNTELQENLLDEVKSKAVIDKKLAETLRDLELNKEALAGMRATLKKMKDDCKDKVVKEKMMNVYGLYRDCLKIIPMILISRVQPLLERKVNDLLTAVTNFTVVFQITDARIDIYLNRSVYDKDANGRMILINNSSGFERFISSLAIRIALMEISQLPSPNMMAIDEGWSCFDNENIGNLQVILDHLSQKFDFILTISHLQVIRQHCDMQIGLVKDDNGFSNVHFG